MLIKIRDDNGYLSLVNQLMSIEMIQSPNSTADTYFITSSNLCSSLCRKLYSQERNIN